MCVHITRLTGDAANVVFSHTQRNTEAHTQTHRPSKHTLTVCGSWRVVYGGWSIPHHIRPVRRHDRVRSLDDAEPGLPVAAQGQIPRGARPVLVRPLHVKITRRTYTREKTQKRDCHKGKDSIVSAWSRWFHHRHSSRYIHWSVHVCDNATARC